MEESTHHCGSIMVEAKLWMTKRGAIDPYLLQAQLPIPGNSKIMAKVFYSQSLPGKS
jgi:hypothetical protein